MERRRVVVTGVGAVTPLGVGAEALIDGWAGGRVGIEDGEGACRDFVPEEHLSRKEVRRADRFTQFALTAGDEAIAAAGWAEEKPYPSERVGCVLASGIGGLGIFES